GELDVFVATHARIRGATRLVLGEEVRNDGFFKFFREIPHVIRNPEDVGCPPGVGGILDGAAASRACAVLGAAAGKRHVHPHNLVSGVDSSGRGDGRIYASRQCCQYFHVCYLTVFSSLVLNLIHCGFTRMPLARAQTPWVEALARRRYRPGWWCSRG